MTDDEHGTWAITLGDLGLPGLTDDEALEWFGSDPVLAAKIRAHRDRPTLTVVRDAP
jgi:hypothetical protein